MKTKEKYWLIVNFLLNYVIIILLRFTWHLSGLQSAHLGLCLSYFERLPRLLYIFLKTWTKTETKKNDFISIPPIEVSKSRVHMWIPSLTHTPVAPVSELINQWSRSISACSLFTQSDVQSPSLLRSDATASFSSRQTLRLPAQCCFRALTAQGLHTLISQGDNDTRNDPHVVSSCPVLGQHFPKSRNKRGKGVAGVKA